MLVLTQADHVPGSLAKQGHWLCSASYWLCLPARAPVGHIAFGCFHQPFWSYGAGRRFQGGWSRDSASCLGGGKPGSRASKTPCLRLQIRQICTTLGSPVSVCFQLGWGYYMVTWSAKVPKRWLLQALSPFSVTDSWWLGSKIALQCLWYEIRVGAPTK